MCRLPKIKLLFSVVLQVVARALRFDCSSSFLKLSEKAEFVCY